MLLTNQPCDHIWHKSIQCAFKKYVDLHQLRGFIVIQNILKECFYYHFKPHLAKCFILKPCGTLTAGKQFYIYAEFIKQVKILTRLNLQGK